MKKLLTLLLLTIMALSVTGCYEQVPAGHKGKIMGKSGFQPEVFPPSKVWLTTFFTTVPEKMYTVQTTTKKYSQPIEVLLSDKLTLGAEIVFRGRINGSDAVINTIFNDLPMNDNVVTTDEVYETYGKMVVLNTAREIISKYNVDEVNTNYQRITIELYNAIKPKLEGLPIEISDVTIGNIQYPPIVTKAIEEAKTRRMQIEKEQAQVQIELEKARGREAVATAQARIKILEARADRDANKLIADGITPGLIKLRELELRSKELDKWNGTLPTTVMGGNVPVIVNTK